MDKRIEYLLYWYRGKLICKEGSMYIRHSGRRLVGQFYRPDKKYNTNCPATPLTIENGKVWVINKNDIPKAKLMLITYQKEKLNQKYNTYTDWCKKYEKEVSEVKSDDKN